MSVIELRGHSSMKRQSNKSKLFNVMYSRLKMVLQAISYSLLLSNFSLISYVHAGPTGGVIDGGSVNGSITYDGLTTTINQNPQLMTVNWDSINLNANENMIFNHGDSSFVTLNNVSLINASNVSNINGRIDALGTIIIVNPNGIFFGPTSQINVGGLIASGLRISPTDFMNGDYIFNEVLGTDGTVVNSGIINASLGGNVALIGKQVKNEGVINARLGSVNMAAGKQAVLTFDNQGLLGVRVSKEILQDELGIDPAVLNSGEINAEGGRVLLTASVSRDVFSQAVNTGELEQASSVLVNDDGSFSLGGGANVVNSGVVDVSTPDGDAGEIVLLGENVTSSGEIKADAINGDGGEIEIHAADTSLLTGNSLTSARSESNGKGGLVKVLGDKVGLFDQSTVDVSGDMGGGTALIGGDYQGSNLAIRNASRTYISEQSKLFADALSSGNGGKLINWADNSTWFYGEAFARGGEQFGDGGLIEISAQNLAFDGYIDLTAANGEMGTLLFDPTDIVIDDQDSCATAPACTNDVELSDDQILSGDGPGPTFYISETELEGLGSGANIVLQATNNITIKNLTNDGVLGLAIDDTDSGSITFTAGNTFKMDDVNDIIQTQGGSVTITAGTVTAGHIDTTGDANQDGGNINITATSGAISTLSLTADGGTTTASINKAGHDGGAITINAGGAIIINGAINAIGKIGNDQTTNNNAGQLGGTGGSVNITTTGGSLIVNAITTTGGSGDGDNSDPGTGGTAGAITLFASNQVTLNGVITAEGGVGGPGTSSVGGNAGVVSVSGNTVLLNNNISIAGGIGAASTGTDGSATVNLTGINAEAIINYASNFTSVINVNGTSATSATLVGADRANIWTIDGADSGGLTGNVVFTDVGSLSANSAGTNTDEFILTGTGSLSGSIDGTGGTNTLKGRNANTTWNITGIDSGNSTHVASFVNIETLEGGSANDDFILSGTGALTGEINGNGGGNSLTARDNIINTWTITDSNVGTVNNIANGFSNIQNLVGGLFNDSFTLTTTNSEITGSINGAGGFNTLTGRDTSTTWNITAANTGSSDDVIAFSDIQNLNGRTKTDDFILTGAGSLTGSIDGGTGDANTLTGRNANTTWNVTGIDSGNSTHVASFANIEDIDGGSANDDFILSGTGALTGEINGNGGSNSLTARDDINNTWAITNSNVGTVNNIANGFSNIQNLVGGLLNDSFTLTTTNSEITGSIDGAGGTNTLTGRDSNTTWNITAANTGSSDDVTTFLNIQNLNGGSNTDNFVLSGIGSLSGSIDGNGGTNSLRGRNDTTNNWNVSTPEGGTVTNITGTFSNIDDLVGGTGDDNFVLSVSGTDLVNSITGNGGTNSLTAGDNATNVWNITAVNTGSVTNMSSFVGIQNLIGGAFNDIFVLSNSGSVSGSIDGNGGTNTLRGRDADTTWNITAANAGNADDIVSFSNINNINGGSADDDFVLSASGALTGSINGNGGNNSLTANSIGTNTWSITTGNGGTVTGVNGFTNIQNITGGSLVDNITFTTALSWIDGLVDGGLGIDTLDAQAIVSSITVKLGSTVDATNLNVDNVETITANNSGVLTNEIIAENKPNTWIIDGANSGRIENPIGPTADTTVNFNNFSKITGGTSDDDFSLNVTFNGSVDGGDHDNFDSVNYSALNNFTVQLGSALGSVQNAERVIGNSTNTLAAEDGTDNTWAIAGTDSGTVAGIIFTDFGTLQGGDQVDTFIVNGGSANIKAGAGDDVLNVNLTGAENGAIVFDGEGHDTEDTVNLLGGTASYEGQYNSNVTVNNHDQFIYTNGANVFDVKYTNTESVQDNLTANTLTVNGTIAADTIDLNTQAFTVNSAATVNYNSANKSNLFVDGQASNDIINILGDISIGNRVTLSAETINNTTASTITANELFISNAVNAGSNVNRLLADVNDLYVTNSASVYVQNANAVNIAQLVNAVLLDVISTTGDITDGVALVSAGELKLKADAGNIVLDNNNQLSGPLSLVASGDVTLNNTTSTDFALVTAQNLTVTSTGPVTDSGVITVSGDTTLNSASEITLDSANDFSNLTATGATNLLINDINNLNVVAIDVNGLADVRANNISLDRINAATVNLDAGSGQITDSNGTSTNITASSIVMRANMGIGSGDAIETSTAELDVINNGAGGLVEIVNTGNVLLTNLVNNGDINFRNDTNVTIDNIDAGFTVGTLQLDVTDGSVFGVDRGGIDYLSVPDITADAAFVTVGSEFGTFERPIVLKLNSEFFLASTISSTYFFGGPPPINNDTSDLQISILDSANSVSGQQLIEIESIADIDPAIFTELHNYSKEDISIRMPRDQMFEDDLENLSRL